MRLLSRHELLLPAACRVPPPRRAPPDAADGPPPRPPRRRLAYDGRGNFVVRTEADLAAGVAALGGFGHGLYAEKWAPFVKELAVMCVRRKDGSVLPYPVVETIHKNNICHVTEAPAAVPEAVQAAARRVAEQAVAALHGAGIFGWVARRGRERCGERCGAARPSAAHHRPPLRARLAAAARLLPPPRRRCRHAASRCSCCRTAASS